MDIRSERQLLLSVSVLHMSIEEVERKFNGICRHFGIVAVYNILTVQTLQSEAASSVPTMRCVLVNDKFNRSAFVLLCLQSWDTILRGCFIIQVTHLHEERNDDLCFGQIDEVSQSATGDLHIE